MSKTFKPSQYQPPLPEHLIINNPAPSEDEIPMDVVFVGGGPAGLAGAIHLSNLVKSANNSDTPVGDIEIAVLEKAADLGGHNLSGAVINPRSFKELFPELKEEDYPFRRKVTGDSLYFLTETGKIPLPTPPSMHNKGNYVASICEVVRWLGEKAEASGVNVLTSFPADSLLMEENRVIGVRTTPSGLDRDGQPGAQHMPANDIKAQITVLTEGTRGNLTQAYLKKANINSDVPQIYALGVKELWKTKKVPKNVIHTMNWPLSTDTFGGSFMYPMGDDMVSFGLVAGLDYADHNLDVHKKLQHLKKHPLFAEYLEGGELVEWGAKTIPEGGFHAFPKKMHGDGILLAGDCVGMVNVPALKGIHYAIKSGILAAETIFESLKAKDTSSAALQSYDQKVKESYIWKDLYKVRNMRQAFKSGFYSGFVKAGLMTLTQGLFPSGPKENHEDADEPKVYNSQGELTNPGVSKVDAVYLSGNKTRDDIPQHLTVGKDISPELADFYAALCPAGVYERQGDKLVVNAPNCVDCKATDVLGPRWQVREGGSGPQYKQM